MNHHPTLLLDGAMGTELRTRGVEVLDHITSIWSAQALLDAPEAVMGVHVDYIEAGADVITINNYAVTRPLLARESMEERFTELTTIAAELGKQARDKAQCEVQIAGSLPPLETSYRPGEVREDDDILTQYREMAALLEPHVDLLLCETLSCGREAKAAATAACEIGKPVWLSWTLQGQLPNQLPSGESLEEAFEAIAHLDIDAYMVNCCGANWVTQAIPHLTALTDRRVGGYANTADTILAQEGDPEVAPELIPRTILDVDGYAEAAHRWLSLGASILGGCCSTRPAHIRRLRRLLDEI